MEPSWEPDNEHVLFVSNDSVNSKESKHTFDIFQMKKDGSGLEQITHGADFNGYPVLTHDGKHIIFVSSRNAAHPGDRNLFIADWEP
jgi:Tol biopolymer transport system component